MNYFQEKKTTLDQTNNHTSYDIKFDYHLLLKHQLDRKNTSKLNEFDTMTSQCLRTDALVDGGGTRKERSLSVGTHFTRGTSGFVLILTEWTLNTLVERFVVQMSEGAGH